MKKLKFPVLPKFWKFCMVAGVWIACQANAARCLTGVAQVGAVAAESPRMASWDSDDRVLVVVDGVSDGAGYAVEGRLLFPGLRLIHLSSKGQPPSGLRSSYRPETYDAHFVHEENSYPQLKDLLRRFRNLRVLAGTETGVALADRLSEDLGTLTNGTRLSEARTDKVLMAAQMAPMLRPHAFLDVMPGGEFTTAQAALENTPFTFPLVVKPTSSAGNFGFTVVETPEQLEEAFGLIGKPDPMDQIVKRLLVQPRYSGRIVAMNTVSHPVHGQTLTDMFETEVQFNGRHIVFLRTRIVRFDPKNPQHQRRMLGARAVAKGLEVAFGPLHPEFLETPNGHLFLMDVGVRPAGGGLTRVARRFGARDQIRTTLLAAFAPARFLEIANAGPQLDGEGALIYFVSPFAGIVQNVPTEEQLRVRIPGFLSADLSHMIVGEWLSVSTSLFDQPGYAVVRGGLAETDAAQAAIREWERSDFYQLRPR